jgi:hypothetical protein
MPPALKLHKKGRIAATLYVVWGEGALTFLGLI